MERTPIDHVLIHARDTLATDGRVGELGLEVLVDDDVVVVRGSVSTAARRDAVVTVVTEVLRAHGYDTEVRDGTRIPESGVPDREPEQL